MHKVMPINYRAEMPMSEEIYPSISLREKDLPELMDWEVGKNYTIVLSVTQVSKEERQGGEVEARFDIKAVGSKNAKKA